MPLLKGDIRFARSANMADVPEGGGPPSAQLLTSGRSNEIFPDISEETRTVGRVEIYQVFGVLRNTDRAALMGSNVVLAQPPADPNVSVTLLSLKNPFATRAEIAKRIESGMSAGSEWGGYLLENHFTTMRSLQVLQRPGSTPPTLGKTYVLVYQEGQSGERRQRIRIKNTSTETRTFTQIVNGQLIDFQAQVTTCELFDGLLYDFPGSTASRFFARDPAKTLIRETVYSDSGMFYSAGRLTAATAINDAWLQVDSVYTQVVPNSRSEVASVDQRPTARQTLTLARAPRLVEVGVTPHTQRIRISEENAGMVFVAQLKPAPAAGTVFIDFWALGQRYTLTDDGAGQLKGHGSGTVNYQTGALSITLKKVPDVGSSINITHGENTAYTNRAGQAGFRAPEFSWSMPHQGIKPGSVVVTWMSGGALKTATDNGTGGFTGHATGEIDYASGKIYLRPTAMIDAGGEFQTAYEYTSTRTENFAAPAVDAGGFGSIVLAEVPAARSVTVRWITVRNVSASSGTSEIVSSSGTGAETVVVTEPQAPGNTLYASKTYAMPGQEVSFSLAIAAPQTVGTYTWRVDAFTPAGASAEDSLVLGGATTGTFEVTAPAQQLGSGGALATPIVGAGSFTLTIAANCPDLCFRVYAANQALTDIAMTPVITVDAVGDQPAPPWETTPPRPAIKTREPIKTATQQGDTSQTVAGMYLGGVDAAGGRVYVAVQPSFSQIYGQGGAYYDPPNSEAEVWTAAELAYGKQMASVNNVSTTYQIWK